MSTPITVPRLLDAARRFERERTPMKTLARGVSFTVAAHGDTILFTIVSSGNERAESVGTLRKVCDRFNTIGSYHPSDYQDVTYNASYTLALIRRVLNG